MMIGAAILLAALMLPLLFCSRGGLIARSRVRIRYEDLELSPSGVLQLRESSIGE